MEPREILRNAGLPADIAYFDNETGRIEATFERPLSEDENLILLSITDPIKYRELNARKNAKEIPNWATYTQAEALDWLLTNIETPLNQPIPPNPITTTQLRAVLVVLADVMKKQSQLDQALIKFALALRDKTWPDLPDR